MNVRRMSSLACTLVAAVALVSSFLVPFVSSDFKVQLPEGWRDNVETGIQKSDAVLSAVERFAGEDAREALAGFGRGLVDWGFDATLGPVGTDTDGEPIPWVDCIVDGKGAAASGLEPCAKSWIIDTAGIPVGERTLPGLVEEVFDNGEVLLGMLLVLFSICFPALKLVLCALLGLGAGSDAFGQRLEWLLHHTSKWSMTDVFVVALLIVFFKADGLNFRFEAELGVYLFAASTIIASIGSSVLSRSTPQAVQQPA